MASVSLNSLIKQFGAVDVVKGINLDIGQGEFVVLVGPSGCGKSTTLRMIAGLEDVTAGEILFDGNVVNDLNPRERNVAMVFQNYALYPHKSVEQNLSFALSQRGVPKKEIAGIVRSTAHLLGIETLLTRMPKELSGGQRQRVAMGRAIVRKPDVFLFDEPLSNLDAALRAQMRVEIKKLHKLLKTTIIYVTHDQVEAMTLADRIVVMDAGKIVQIGKPLEIYNTPKTKFVAGFIGAPKINFIPATIEEEKSGQLVAVLVSGTRLNLPKQRNDCFGRYKNQAVEIALRPEHIHEGNVDLPGASKLTTVVEVIEPMGADTIVICSVDAIEISVRLPSGFAALVGDELPLTLDLMKAHLIDLKTGNTVS